MKSAALAALLLVALAGAMALALVLSGSNAEVAKADSLPSAKASIAINELIGLSQLASGAPGSPGSGSTGWQDVLSTQIKTANQKDLLFDAAFQCGIVTDTTVSSKNGSQSSSTARGTIAVRVLVDGQPAEPDNSTDALHANASGVVYCDRSQQLLAKFSGLNCHADLTTGDVTCDDPETLELILKTLNANAFNFAKKDVTAGVHSITVQAKADASAIVDDPVGSGALAGAEAFIGAGSLDVESVRLVNHSVDGVDPIVDVG
jgi:hypothetical protein